MSETKLHTIEQKLLIFSLNVEKIKTNLTNPHFKNHYASLTQVLDSVKPILTDLGLVLTQPVIDGTVYSIITDIESKQQVMSGIPLPTGLSAQNTCGAITYFRRYTLTGLLALAIDDDDDGNKASGIEKEPTEQKESLPWLNKFSDKAKTQLSESWVKVVAAIQDGYTIEQVQKKYKLNKDIKKELEALKK